MLFINPVEVHVSQILLNNNIFGPYSEMWKMSRDTDINLRSLPLSGDRENILKQLLSTTSIDMGDEIKKVKEKNNLVLNFPSSTPYHDWLRRRGVDKSKSVENYFGLYVVRLI